MPEPKHKPSRKLTSSTKRSQALAPRWPGQVSGNVLASRRKMPPGYRSGDRRDG